jgi:AraC family ethanolamine operon transcriptional activator
VSLPSAQPHPHRPPLRHQQPGKAGELTGLVPGSSEQRWSSVEELQAVMARLGLDLQLLQLEGGAMEGRLIMLEVPPLRLVQLQLNRRVHSLGTKPKGVLTVSLDLDPSLGEIPWRVHGQMLPSDSLFGLDLSQEVHLTLPTKANLGLLFLPLEGLRQWGERLGWTGFGGELQPPVNVLRMSPSSSTGLRLYLRRLFAAAQENPARLRLPATERLILDDLMPLLLEALVSGPIQPMVSPRPPARIGIVKEVQRWMHHHPTQPITLTELCLQAHASRRTLIQGFQDHLGMGPMAYLKLLRLHGIRRRLLQADPRAIQIGALADEWGFYNAGHFAADYRRLFGERPRETLRRVY